LRALAGRLGQVTDTPADGSAGPTRPEATEPDATATETGALTLEELVGSWLTVPDVAERLGISLAAVRRMIEDRQLVSWRVGERRVVSVPERFLDEAVLPHLPGTFTVLTDGGMNDEELLRWLFTADSTLPAGGSPVEALGAGFKTEVRRRAMETAW
jgi:excisionase family DNA binding protein